MYITKTKIKKRKIRFLLFIISLISFSSYSQSTNNYNLSTQFSFHITEANEFTKVKFKTLPLQLDYMAQGKTQLPKLINLHTEPPLKFREDFYIKSINSSSTFIDIKDWDNPYGVGTPAQSIILSGLNSFLQSIQD